MHRSTADMRAWALVESQHGVISRTQLLDLGFHPRSIEHRVASGRLHPVAPGTYAVGRPALSKRGKWMAALLGCGSRAVLSHSSAAALWGFHSELGDEIEVISGDDFAHRRPGLKARRSQHLRARDRTIRDRIPLTVPARTLVDLATIVPAPRLERAVNEADRLGLTDPETLRAALYDYRGVRGVARLRTILDKRSFRMTASELERRFLALVDRSGLPLPVTGALIDDFEVDFFWPDLGLVVETDGLRYHRTPSQQARDRLRDQTHTAAGLVTLRFTQAQVRYEPLRVLDVLGRTAANLQAER